MNMARQLYAGLSYEQVVQRYARNVYRACCMRLQNIADVGEYIDNSFHPLTYYSDFNRDGERDITDATCIQRYLAGLPYPKYR